MQKIQRRVLVILLRYLTDGDAAAVVASLGTLASHRLILVELVRAIVRIRLD